MSNAPRSLTIQNFRSEVDRLGQVAKSARFAVRIIPQGSKIGRAHV